MFRVGAWANPLTEATTQSTDAADVVDAVDAVDASGRARTGRSALDCEGPVEAEGRLGSAEGRLAGAAGTALAQGAVRFAAGTRAGTGRLVAGREGSWVGSLAGLGNRFSWSS